MTIIMTTHYSDNDYNQNDDEYKHIEHDYNGNDYDDNDKDYNDVYYNDGGGWSGAAATGSFLLQKTFARRELQESPRLAEEVDYYNFKIS